MPPPALPICQRRSPPPHPDARETIPAGLQRGLTFWPESSATVSPGSPQAASQPCPSAGDKVPLAPLSLLRRRPRECGQSPRVAPASPATPASSVDPCSWTQQCAHGGSSAKGYSGEYQKCVSACIYLLKRTKGNRGEQRKPSD